MRPRLRRSRRRRIAHGVLVDSRRQWTAALAAVALSLAPVSASDGAWVQRLDHGKFRSFPTYEEANVLFQEWTSKYPSLLVRQQIGVSYEKREIFAFRLSATEPAGLGPRPQVLITALMHSREPASLTVVLYLVGHLLELYDRGDPAAVYVIENREIWIVPFVNPDGYIANQRNPSQPVIRKNRRWTCANPLHSGVDINRNFPIAWKKGRFSMCGEEYQGTEPFSEPETKALKALCDRNAFKAAMNFHTFGSMLTHPYNFASTIAESKLKNTDDQQIYNELQRVFQFDKFGPAIKTVGYTAPGESDDWFYEAKGIIAMSPEVGPESGDFFPPQSEIKGIDSRNFVRTMHLVNKVGLELFVTWRRSVAQGNLESLVLEMGNSGMSASGGESLSVIVSGVSVLAALLGDSVSADDGPVTARALDVLGTPALGFQVKPLPRRSRRSLQLRVAAASASDKRPLQLCVLEAGSRVCQCTPSASVALSEQPQANLAAFPVLPGAEAEAAEDMERARRLCSSIAGGAVALAHPPPATVLPAATPSAARSPVPVPVVQAPVPAPMQPPQETPVPSPDKPPPPSHEVVASPGAGYGDPGPQAAADAGVLGPMAVAVFVALLFLLALSVRHRIFGASVAQATVDEEVAPALQEDSGTSGSATRAIGPLTLGARELGSLD